VSNRVIAERCGLVRNSSGPYHHDRKSLTPCNPNCGFKNTTVEVYTEAAISRRMGRLSDSACWIRCLTRSKGQIQQRIWRFSRLVGVGSFWTPGLFVPEHRRHRYEAAGRQHMPNSRLLCMVILAAFDRAYKHVAAPASLPKSDIALRVNCWRCPDGH
jgi:hypothetical protein